MTATASLVSEVKALVSQRISIFIMKDDNLTPKKRPRLPPECEQEEVDDSLQIKSRKISRNESLSNNQQKLSHLGRLCNDQGMPVDVLQLKHQLGIKINDREAINECRVL